MYENKLNELLTSPEIIHSFRGQQIIYNLQIICLQSDQFRRAVDQSRTDDRTSSGCDGARHRTTADRTG